MSDKPRVAVLGGCGFIGRTLVQHLVENNLASKILVVDKAMPQLSPFNKAQTAAFDSATVIYKQGNLSREASCKNAFAEDGGNWEVVFNLAAESKFGQSEAVYKENVVDLAGTASRVAKESGAKRWIEVSTAQVYEPSKKPSKEDSGLKPWTKLAQAKKQAEDIVAQSGLHYVILRPAVVYGPGDVLGLMPRIICGATYKYTGKKMEFLWGDDLRINTVHVDDVIGACVHVLKSDVKSGEIFNLADENDTTQETFNKILESIFGIKCKCMGWMASKAVTSIAMSAVAEGANEKHLKPWSDLLKEKQIVNSPLTPYLDEELLSNNAMSIDGSKIVGAGFKYSKPKMSEADIKAAIQHWVDLKYFPADFI